jgi:NAD-reducing hydrogenase large subunit
MEEMPVITQRICGICPVSHQLASAKACDAILGVEIPETARLLRELLHMGQYIQSHALHFFYLASPDLLLGWNADPAKRNVVGVIAGFPEAARQGVGLRKFGQEIIKALAGKKIHPPFSIPGGVSDPLLPPDRDRILAGFDQALQACQTGLELLKGWLEKNLDQVREFANFESMYAGLVDEQGRTDFYDGRLRMTDARGKPVAEFDPADYLDHIGEHVEPWSYMKFPFYKAKGYPEGIYRVGPLGRLNSTGGLSTPKAAAELENFRSLSAGGLNGGSLLYHYARLIELLHALERAEEILDHGDICRREVRLTARPLNGEGVGVIEAPRGTLIHHYWVDGKGAIEKVNLIVATGHNNLAMNRAVGLVAERYLDPSLKEESLNRIEGAIRCYDPCLSCATHALGRMPLKVEWFDAGGRLVRELGRD